MRISYILLLIHFSFCVAAQVQDSAVQKKRSLGDIRMRLQANKADSIKTHPTQNDSLPAPNTNDTLKVKRSQQVDSARQKVQSLTQLPQQADSLYGKATVQQIDSLQQKLNNLQERANAPLQNAETKLNEKLNQATTAVGETGIEPKSVDIPHVQSTLPHSGINTPDIDLGDANKELLPDVNPAINLPKETEALKEMSGKLEGVGEATIKLGSYQSDVANIKENGLQQSKELPKLAEQKITDVDEINFIKSEAGKMNLPEGGMMGEDAAKDMLKEQAKTETMKVAKDHFAGKQEALMGAMQKLSDLKSTYASLDSLNVPKRKPNAMKGKSLRERLVPALTLQIQKSQYWLLDINPSVAYRITGRWSAGLGWNQRLGFVRFVKTTEQEKVYGPRAFAEFRWAKGFSLRVEAEQLYGIPSPTFATPKTAEEPSRWITSAFVGIKKDYKISGRLRGTLQVLYLVYDDLYSSPYGEKLNSRIGFEYVMKKATKK